MPSINSNVHDYLALACSLTKKKYIFLLKRLKLKAILFRCRSNFNFLYEV